MMTSKHQMAVMSVGPLETNCYLVWETATKTALCIDPGGNSPMIAGDVERLGLRIAAIALTHGHGDHLGAVETLRRKWGVPVWIHEADAAMLTSAERNLSAMVGLPVATEDAEHSAEHNGAIRFGATQVEVIHTPGHTRGSSCFLVREADGPWLLYSGDTLFCGDVGRCDLPGGSITDIRRSIAERLYVLPENTVVYPGHGPATTIGREKRENQDVRADEKRG